MTQYPNEKDPQSDWVYPGQQAPYAAPPCPPPTQNSPYAPAASSPNQGSSYAVPSQYHAQTSSLEGFPPPEGPPPDYVSAQGGSAPYDQKNPSGYPPEKALPPPPSSDPYGALTPGAGPSSSSSSSPPAQDGGHGGIMMSIAAFFGNKGPPTMWQRQPPPQLPYNAFPAMCLISNNGDLSNGFPDLPPPCQLNPHPFATHDVTEEDWKRFLSDLKKAAGLSPAQRIRSNVLPMVMGMGIFGMFMTSAMGKNMKYKNRGAAGDLVDHWNHYFFGPRKMEAVLCQAAERLSGKLGSAPVGDPSQESMAHGLRRGDHDSPDESSSSEDENYQRFGRGGILAERQGGRFGRRERREARRARRGERRARKARGDDQQPYQLFITAINQ